MKLYLVKNKTLPKCYLGQEDTSHKLRALWNSAIEIMVRGLSHWNFLAFVRNTIRRPIPDMMNQNWWGWAWEFVIQQAIQMIEGMLHHWLLEPTP